MRDYVILSLISHTIFEREAQSETRRDKESMRDSLSYDLSSLILSLRERETSDVKQQETKRVREILVSRCLSLSLTCLSSLVSLCLSSPFVLSLCVSCLSSLCASRALHLLAVEGDCGSLLQKSPIKETVKETEVEGVVLIGM